MVMAGAIVTENEDTAFHSSKYTPGADFNENQGMLCADISPTDSMEFWLIQEPMNQLMPQDFHGKEISLKTGRDKFGKLTSSSGKSYDIVPFTSRETNAIAFLRGASNFKKGVKISRHVCLVHYPDATDLDKPKISLNVPHAGAECTGMSSKQMGGNDKIRTFHTTSTSTHTTGLTAVSTKLSSRKRSRESSSFLTGMSSHNHSQVSHPETCATEGSFGSLDKSAGNVSKKEKKSKH